MKRCRTPPPQSWTQARLGPGGGARGLLGGPRARPGGGGGARSQPWRRIRCSAEFCRSLRALINARRSSCRAMTRGGRWCRTTGRSSRADDRQPDRSSSRNSPSALIRQALHRPRGSTTSPGPAPRRRGRLEARPPGRLRLRPPTRAGFEWVLTGRHLTLRGSATGHDHRWAAIRGATPRSVRPISGPRSRRVGRVRCFAPSMPTSAGPCVPAGGIEPLNLAELRGDAARRSARPTPRQLDRVVSPGFDVPAGPGDARRDGSGLAGGLLGRHFILSPTGC